MSEFKTGDIVKFKDHIDCYNEKHKGKKFRVLKASDFNIQIQTEDASEYLGYYGSDYFEKVNKNDYGIEQVWRTSDGRIFDNQHDAEKHSVDFELNELIEMIVKQYPRVSEYDFKLIIKGYSYQINKITAKLEDL